MSTLKTTSITHGSNSGTANLTLASDGKVTIPEKKLYCPGAIVQIVQSSKLDTWDTTTTFADISGTDQAGSGSVFCCKITPTASSSKVLVKYIMYMGSQNATHKESYMLRKIGSGGYTGVQQTAQGGTIFTYSGNADVTHHQEAHVFEYLDSPNTTSEVEYKLQGRCGTDTVYVNRKHSATTVMNTSYITLMEVAG